MSCVRLRFNCNMPQYVNMGIIIVRYTAFAVGKSRWSLVLKYNNLCNIKNLIILIHKFIVFSGLKFIVLSFRLVASSLHQKDGYCSNLCALSYGVEDCVNV